jgi:hypothetical protein
MDILKEMAQAGRKILTDTKQKKNATEISKPIKVKITEAPTDIHAAFVKKCIKEKPKKQVLVDFFQMVCESEEKKL